MSILVRDLQSRFIRYFTVLYEMRNITQAAERLCITQPALSNSVRTLERQMNITLFDRTPQGIVPTAYADALYRRAKMSEAELYLATAEMEQIRDSGSGRVRLGVGPSMLGVCSHFLPRALAARPRLEVNIVEGPARHLTEQVSAGRVDVAICTMPHGITPADLDFEFVTTLPTVAVVRADHPLMGRPVERLDLTNYPWVVADSALESSTEDLMKLFADQRPQTITSTNSPTLMRMMIATSDFIGFMPKIVLAHNESSKTIGALDLIGGIYDRRLVIITRTKSFLPPASAFLMQQFRQAIDALGIIGGERRTDPPATTP